MANGMVKVSIEAAGIKQMQKALRGVVSEANQANKSRENSNRRTGQTIIQIENLILNSQVSNARKAAREEEKHHKTRERNLRQYLRAARNGVGMAARGAVAIGGAASAVAGRGQGLAGELGFRSRGELVQRRMSQQMNLIRLANQTGRRDDVGSIQSRVAQVSQNTLVDQDQVIGALNTAQNRFSAFDTFYANIDRIAEASQATGTDLNDMVGALGEFQRQMGVSTEEFPELIGAIIEASKQGSIEVADIAGSFASLIGSYQRLTGRGGTGGAREFLGVSQVLGAGGRDASQTATLLENLLAKLSSSDVQRSMERTLGDRSIFDDSGKLTIGIDALVGKLTDRNLSPAQLQGILGRDMQANQAVGILTSTVASGRAAGNANALTTIQNSSSSAGNATVANTMEDIRGSATGQAMGAAIRTENTFMTNADAFITATTAMVEPLMELNAQYPLQIEALGTLTDAIKGAGVGLATLGLAGGGASAAAGAGAAGTAGAGAGALGLGTIAAGGAAGIAAAGAATVAAGAAGYFGAKALGADAIGERIGNAIFEMINGRGPARTQARPQTVTLDPQAAQAIGTAVSNANTRGAPADGRTSGEPGRR